MWFVGPTSQGAFVITTSDGLILLDTLNNTQEARDILLPSMQKAGLDPTQVAKILVARGLAGPGRDRVELAGEGVDVDPEPLAELALGSLATLELHMG